MALVIQKIERPAEKLVSDRRLYLTGDRSRVVEEGDPAAAFLLVSANKPIPAVEVDRLGLVMRDGRVSVFTAEPEKTKPAAAQSEPRSEVKGPKKARG